MFRYLILIFLFNAQLVLADKYEFSPDYCEFSVRFPQPYKSFEVSKSGAVGLSARVKTKNSIGLNAECWPNRLPTPLDQLPIEVMAQELEKEMQQRGVVIGSVIIDKEIEIGPQIILSGRINAEGQKLFVKMIAIIGRQSLLELLIVERDMVSQTQMNFRNSIKRKY